jgi:hypothetical protein
MALKTADFDSAILPYKIINETVLSGSGSGTATVLQDLTNGEVGQLLSITAHNASAAIQVLKMTFTEASITLGTTTPELMLTLPASTVLRYTMPEGIDFTTLSMWCVTSTAENATTAPNAAVAVTLTTS